MAKRLIINADDYGRTEGVSTGIRYTHLNGIVTSTTAMMNIPGVENDLEKAQRECPLLGLGVHLVLTAGRPLLPPSQVASLTGAMENFPSVSQFIKILAGIDPDQARSEWSAQINKFIRITGKKPDHLDSHHHTSYFSHSLFKVMLELAREHGCGIRPPLSEKGSDLSIDLPADLGDQPGEFLPALINQFAPRFPDTFFSSFYGQHATRENLFKLLSSLPEGTSELMCHPGYSDGELVETSSYNIRREVELGILIDPGLKDFIRNDNIQMISYAQLYN